MLLVLKRGSLKRVCASSVEYMAPSSSKDEDRKSLSRLYSFVTSDVLNM